MMYRRMLFLFVPFSLLLGGCGIGNAEKPVIPILTTNTLPFFSKGGNYTEMTALTAERRVVILSQTKETEHSTANIRTCSEAPPDVAIAFSRDIQANFTGSAQTIGKLADPQIAAAYRNAVAAAAMALTQRSQGLQLYRNSSFDACQAFLNGIYSVEDYKAKMVENLKISAELIKLQIANLPELDQITAPSITGTETLVPEIPQNPAQPNADE